MPTFDEYKAYQEFEEGMFLEHYGTKRHSGRYPWGSGDEPYQHDANWLARVERYEAAGVKGKALADKLGITTTQLRTWKPIAKAQRRALLSIQKIPHFKSMARRKASGRKIQRICTVRL